jgi:hypothetical protein
MNKIERPGMVELAVAPDGKLWALTPRLTLVKRLADHPQANLILVERRKPNCRLHHRFNWQRAAPAAWEARLIGGRDSASSG